MSEIPALRIGKVGRKSFTLPAETAGEAIAILAKRGAGKTNTATVIVEEMVRAGVQVVVLDPVGAWWGLRSAADSKNPGLPIPILGGQHGDVPLEDTAGDLIADVVVDTGSSMLLDLSDFPTKAAMNRFATAFAKRLFYRKARAKSPLHIVLEEADQFCPQGKNRGEEALVGAYERMVRLGRGRGIGITMVTQRSAKLNKDILTQADVLVAMRTTGPHDRKAIKAWVSEQADGDTDVVGTLHELKTGEAWFWNPEREVLSRVQVRRRSTFDSSATPKVGQKRNVEPTAQAAINLDALGEQIQATVEKAKANDPAAIKRELAQAQARIRQLEAETQEPDPAAIAAAEARGGDAALRSSDEIRRKVRSCAAQIIDAARTIGEMTTALYQLTEEPWGAAPAVDRNPPAGRRASSRPTRRAPAPIRTRKQPVSDQSPSGYSPSTSQQKILDALAELEVLGNAQPTRTQLAVFVGVPHTSGGYKNNLGALRTAGILDYPNPGCVSLTPSGHSLARSESPTSRQEIHDRFRSLLTESQGEIFDYLAGAWPSAVTRQEVADAVDVPATSGGFKNNLGRMRTLGILDYPQPGQVVATDVLFPEGLY